jgi:hypothetical protein
MHCPHCRDYLIDTIHASANNSLKRASRMNQKLMETFLFEINHCIQKDVEDEGLYRVRIKSYHKMIKRLGEDAVRNYFYKLHEHHEDALNMLSVIVYEHGLDSLSNSYMWLSKILFGLYMEFLEIHQSHTCGDFSDVVCRAALPPVAESAKGPLLRLLPKPSGPKPTLVVAEEDDLYY